MQTDTRNIYSCCCFGNKGSATLTTQFEKDTYMPDEICKAMVDLNNSNCASEVKSISIKLTRHVEIRDDSGKLHSEIRQLEDK